MSIIDEIMSLSTGELSKFTKSEADMNVLRKYFKGIRRSVGATKAAFTRADEYSYALEKYLAEAEKRPKMPINEMTRHRLIAEIASFQKFKESETSSVAGARKVYREQDIRIFGKDASGRPLGSMNRYEREQFWRIYEEWEKMYRKTNPDLSSSQVQMNLADLMLNNPLSFGESLFTQKLEMLTEYARQQQEEISRTGFGFNVHSGFGNDF